jgi:O-succinylbenzoic acid--CoA ligase
MDILSKASDSNPKKTALYYKEKTYTYEQLNHWVNAIQKTLNSSLKEIRVGIKLSDPLEALLCIWACLREGKQIYLLNHHHKTYADTLAKQFNLNTIITLLPKDEISQNKAISLPNQSKHAKIHLFTAGTTGKPKCVIHTLSTLVHSAHAVINAVDFKQSDCWHCQLPLYHVSGLAIIIRTFLATASLQILSNNQQVTHISCVEKQLQELLKQPTSSKLKCILLGGSKINQTLLTQGLNKKLPIYQSYGLTELGSTCTLAPLTQETISFSGNPLPHIKIKIKNNFIHIKSPALCIGYETQDQKITKISSNTFYNTNDLGNLSKTNQLLVKGRSSRMIIINGENIHLETIEAFIKTCKNIKQCFLSPIKRTSQDTYYAIIELNTPEKKFEERINNEIKAHFSSLYVPEKIINHQFKDSIKPSHIELQSIIETL